MKSGIEGAKSYPGLKYLEKTLVFSFSRHGSYFLWEGSFKFKIYD